MFLSLSLYIYIYKHVYRENMCASPCRGLETARGHTTKSPGSRDSRTSLHSGDL